MKAILVIDMPDNCLDCPCSYVSERTSVLNYCQVDECGIGLTDYNMEVARPKWCPLKPMPQKYDEGTMREQKGWNACLDEIIGEKE